MRTIRSALAIALALVGLMGTVSSVGLIALANERQAQDSYYLACFRAAAGIGVRPGEKSVISGQNCPDISAEIYDPTDAGYLAIKGFGPIQENLSFWRGEWFEYYAPKSGRTTLLASPTAYWSAFGTDCLFGFLIGLAGFGTAYLLFRTNDRKRPGYA